MPSEVLVCLEPSWEVGGTESPDLGPNATGPGQSLSPMDPWPDRPSPVLLIVEATGIVIGIIQKLFLKAGHTAPLP